MPLTDAQRRATMKYRKANMKQVVVAFYPNDKELYEYLDTKDNKSAYIRDLIRKDMEAKK